MVVSVRLEQHKAVGTLTFHAPRVPSRVKSCPHVLIDKRPDEEYHHHTHIMANFFDIRARQKEAAANASSSKAPAQPEKNKLQPWVEK